MTDPAIFKAYDIRGIYPDQINEDNIKDIVSSIYTFFTQALNKNNLTIVLGRDMRISSPSLSKKAQEVLIELGAQVVDIGLSTTPSVYYAVYKYKYDGGIQISASHNPKQYNGLKFFYQKDGKLVKVAKNTGMDKVKEIALNKSFVKTTTNGKLEEKNVLDEEIQSAYDIVGIKTLRPLKVVADPANSMGIMHMEKIFNKISGSQLIKLNFELDGTFPAHEANPLKFHTLKELQAKVIETKADLGIATDGDADRIYFINEKGEIIPATLITALIAREILNKKKGEIILVDIRYTKNAQKVIEDNGGKMQVNIVGHSLITEHLNRVGAAFAGESSGHYFFRETGGAESSIRVIYHVLDVLTKDPRPISKILAELHSSNESSEFNYKLPSNLNSKEVLEKIAQQYPEGKVSWLDGLTIDFPDWRFNIRSSNTEPLIRLNLEATSLELMKEKLKEVADKILGFGAKAED